MIPITSRIPSLPWTSSGLPFFPFLSGTCSCDFFFFSVCFGLALFFLLLCIAVDLGHVFKLIASWVPDLENTNMNSRRSSGSSGQLMAQT